jgi:integrase
MARLTDLMLTKLPVPETGAIVYPDETLTGFGVRVSHGGTRTFVLTHGRERRRISIGRVGVIGLADARKSAKQYLASETLGKRSTRSIRWQAGVDEYLAEVERDRKPRTHKDYKRLLGRFKFPGLLVDIHPQDIARKLDRLEKHPIEKLHAFAALRQFFNWAYRKHYLEVSPMARMQQPDVGSSRDRILSDDELTKIWKACLPDNFGRLVRALILLGQRRGELSAVTSDMIEGDILTLPAWLTKNGRTHSIPLSDFARTVLSGGVAWSGFSKSKKDLDERCGVTGWTLHDLRRTFASGLASKGVAIAVVEKLLNHVSGSFRGVVGIYNRYDFLPEMRVALEKWEAHVISLPKD